MIYLHINLHYFNSYHLSYDLRKKFTYIFHPRIQDPTPIFWYPYHMILCPIHSMSGKFRLHFISLYQNIPPYSPTGKPVELCLPNRSLSLKFYFNVRRGRKTFYQPMEFIIAKFVLIQEYSPGGEQYCTKLLILHYVYLVLSSSFLVLFAKFTLFFVVSRLFFCKYFIMNYFFFKFQQVFFVFRIVFCFFKILSGKVLNNFNIFPKCN